ncbi:MAG: lamin tail domain-containing protein [Spirochaetales bacterium]|nr:lamin tail domain-containing protein [Spirochaetales bacterium]
MTKKRGIWSGIVKEMETVRNNFIIAVDVHYDAEGNDNENLNDEYFALKNISDKPLDLSSWKLSDAKGKHSFTFPEMFILKPQKSVYIYSGIGSKRSYCSFNKPVRRHSLSLRFYRLSLFFSLI